VAKWNNREECKKVAKRILKDADTEKLRRAKRFLDGLLDLRKSEKLFKTYINGTRAAVEYNQCNKVFVDYKMDGTSTGRLSCSMYSAEKPMGVSFHTLPRTTETNIRSMFKAPDDWAFITVDYSAMELRVLAHIADEPAMQKAFKSGVDLHTYTGQLLFRKEEITKEERQIAKMVSFLIVYGGGAFNLSETMGISMKRAEDVIMNYQRVYPGIFRYMERVNDFIRRNKYAETIFGRKRRLTDVSSRDPKVQARAMRQGLNFTIQSAASDILLCGLVGLKKRLDGMQARAVATVHDSIELVCPKEEVQKTLEIVYDELVNYPTIRKVFNLEFAVPLKIDAEVGRSFGDGLEVHFADGVPTNVDELIGYLDEN